MMGPRFSVGTRKPESSRSPAFLPSQRHAGRVVRFFAYALVPTRSYVDPRPRHECEINRTRLIRDAALATGTSCIACGLDAVAKLGKYPVCVRHQRTVTQPAPDQHWKANVRAHHKRIPMRACQWCGSRKRLSRHHEWKTGWKGQPPRPIVLCGLCHAVADGRLWR